MWGRWGDPITAGGQGWGLLVSPSLGVWQLWGHWGCCWRPVVVSLILLSLDAQSLSGFHVTGRTVGLGAVVGTLGDTGGAAVTR